MKELTIIFFVVLVMFSAAYAKDYEINKKAGDLNVSIKIDRNPPVTSSNNFTIRITDAAGKAVTDAKVLLSYSMPPMPGMPPGSFKVEPAISGEVYKAKVSYSMAGSWNHDLKITHGGKTVVSTKFTIDVR